MLSLLAQTLLFDFFGEPDGLAKIKPPVCAKDKKPTWRLHLLPRLCHTRRVTYRVARRTVSGNENCSAECFLKESRSCGCHWNLLCLSGPSDEPRHRSLREAERTFTGEQLEHLQSGQPMMSHKRKNPASDAPISEWNTLCAHGCVVFDGDSVFCLRNTGARAGPTTVWALWTQDNRGPHGRNRSQALRCVHQPPLPVDPTLFWFSRLSLVCLLHLMVPSVS